MHALDALRTEEGRPGLLGGVMIPTRKEKTGKSSLESWFKQLCVCDVGLIRSRLFCLQKTKSVL